MTHTGYFLMSESGNTSTLEEKNDVPRATAPTQNA
jgi:hypothetical protein